MRAKRILVPSVLLLGFMLCCLACGKDTGGDGAEAEAEAPASAAPDSQDLELLFAYIQGHFDDIHDVTMRYHHKDHTINGRVVIDMTWEGGALKSAEVVGNETGDEDLPGSMIEKMRGWNIEGLDGPAQVTVPFKVQLVGLDDPEFPNMAILTGEVVDADGKPLKEAMILIRPEVAGQVYRAETSREGIFVRTLIPPGTWDVECSLSGYGTVTKPGVKLSAGDHEREKFVLEKK
jgi:hypothetical protein